MIISTKNTRKYVNYVEVCGTISKVDSRGDGMKKEQPQDTEDNNQFDDNQHP